MTQDEIIMLANKAGWDVVDLDDGFGIRLKKFAALVEEKATAIEREACARVCEQSAQNYYPVIPEASGACTHLATAIRARGQA
jgi:hypothetical protein